MTAPLPLTALVDSRVGIVRELVRIGKDRREPRLPIIHQAVLSHFDYHKAGALERSASGKGVTEEASVTSAIVEALERYCASQRNVDAVVMGAASSLDAPAILPEELVLYSDRQYATPGFAWSKPPADPELSWIGAALVSSGRPVYAPACLAYMVFGAGARDEPFAPATSNGLAGGRGLPSAILAGILELVERDAFLITWLNRLPVPRIAFDGTHGVAAQIGAHYRRAGVEVVAFDITTELEIPAVMAIGFDRSGDLPAATVGLGCSLDPATALDRAVMEVAQIRSATVGLFHRYPPVELVKRYEDIDTLEDHATFVADPEHLNEFDFLFDGPVRDLTELASHDLGSVEANLDHCRAQLETAGCTVAYADMTLPDVVPFGIRIARAIVTELQPMHFGYGQDRLGSRRLFDVPRRLGYTAAATTEDDLNPCPHPLA